MIPTNLQKVFAGTLLVFFLYGGWLFILGPWTQNTGLDWQEFTNSHERLQRYQHLVELNDSGQYGDIKSQLTNLEERLFQAETPALALANMRGVVNDIMRSINISMTSNTSVSFEDIGTLTKIGFRARLTLENDQLIDFLSKIEGGEQRIFVESMDISLAPGRPNEAPKLDVQLVLGGYANVGGIL